MPRAFDAPVGDRPLVQRAAPVGAPVGEGVDAISGPDDEDRSRLDGDHDGLTLDEVGVRDGVGPLGGGRWKAVVSTPTPIA